jgi:uncharacterized protein YkwD
MATELELYLLGKINADRAQVGALPLTIDEELSTAALRHSQWMDQSDTLSHTGENGSQPDQRIADAGYTLNGAWGENATQNYAPGDLDRTVVDDMHTSWMNSPGHRANLLSPTFTEIGIGLVKGDHQGQPYAWGTEVFSIPTAAEAAETDKATAPNSPTTTPPATTPPATTPPTTTPPATIPPQASTTEMEDYLLQLVNNSRIQAGLAGLTLSGTLSQAAGDHAAAMDRTDTADLSDTPNTWENTWYTYGTGTILDRAKIDEIHNAMMNNTGVRDTILRAEITEIGIGVQLGDYQGLPAVWVDQLFA